MIWPCSCPVSDSPLTHPPLLSSSTRPDSCNGHRKVSNALPEPDRSHPHLGSYSSAVSNRMHPLLLGLARSCFLHFSFPTQQCAVVKIFLTSEPTLFCPDQRGELVVTLNHTCLVSTFHGHVHWCLCQLNHLTIYTKHLDLKDLETCEHIFSKSNALVSTIQYAGTFHHKQVISGYFQHNNGFEVYANLCICFTFWCMHHLSYYLL